MGRERIDLRLFNTGLISNPDQEDIPNEAQSEGSRNLDVETLGKLRGIPKHTSASSNGGEGIRFAWIETNEGNWDLIYTNGTGLYVISDFYGSDTASSLSTSYAADVIVPNNREVHIGRYGDELISAWAGYISHGQFGGAVPSGIQLVDANPEQPSTDCHVVPVSHTAASPEDGVFFPGIQRQYRMTFVYDGYQESPIGGHASSSVQLTGDYDYIQLTVGVDDWENINPRITGVKVYCREKPFFDSSIYADYQEFIDTTSKLPYDLRPQRSQALMNKLDDFRYATGTFGEYGEYKLVEDIDINDSGWITSGTSKSITINDVNELGSTYTNNTGIPESDEDDFGLSYALATTCNNMLFAANASHTLLPTDEAAHMLFRSKPYRYDTFDWVNDKIIMPTIPKAMKSHRGKLYVWDENTTYIIDPINFQIIQTVKGRGCSSQDSVVETDYGLFWANKNGVYWSTQTEELIQPTKDNLTEPIKSQFQSAIGSYTPKLVYNSGRSQLLVHLGSDVYAYHTVEKRWDYYPDFKLVEEDETTGAFIGKDGETYTVTEGGIYKDFSSSEREYWLFYSKEFMLEDVSQEKKFYKLISDYSGTVTIEYSLDGGDTWITATGEDITVQRAKTIKLKIGAASESAILDSISIIYRRLRGKR